VRLAVAVEGGHVVVAWALGWLFGHPPFELVELRWAAVGWGVLATCPPLAVVWCCTRSRWQPLVRLMHEVHKKLVPAFARCSIHELVLISVLAGVGEEALFRGFIQSALAYWLHPWLALLLTSIVFGLGHLITPAYAILAGLLGLYLGTLALIYENLLMVMIVHGLYDLLALLYLTRTQQTVNGTAANTWP
jgi:membrane protease YdiL (CAAX protease family)